ncbi:amino acid permease [Gemmatimonas sp.]|uniref:amino acid permease n=1 Tax=Gemmatimonas sp. TaxID=1962908 RepID=UPI0039838FE3
MALIGLAVAAMLVSPDQTPAPAIDMAGELFVAASVARRLFGSAGDTVLRLLTVVSLLASVNALQLMASRIPFARNRDGLLPSIFHREHPGVTLVPALLAGTALTLGFIAANTFDTVLALLAFLMVAN